MNIGDMVEQDTRRFACPLSVPVEVPGDSTREHLINKEKKGSHKRGNGAGKNGPVG